jgi:hypothetical protein
VTPISDNASRTSSSLNGLMTASIFFIVAFLRMGSEAGGRPAPRTV